MSPVIITLLPPGNGPYNGEGDRIVVTLLKPTQLAKLKKKNYH